MGGLELLFLPFVVLLLSAGGLAQSLQGLLGVVVEGLNFGQQGLLQILNCGVDRARRDAVLLQMRDGYQQRIACLVIAGVKRLHFR